MRTIYAFIFVCFIFSTGYPQGFNLYDPLKQNPDAGITGLQLAFDEWAKDKDLSKTKTLLPQVCNVWHYFITITLSTNLFSMANSFPLRQNF